MSDEIIRFIRNIYNGKKFIPLHEPYFSQNEKDLLIDCIDSTFVSSVGKYVTQFEQMICEYTGSKFAIATMNGTAALHMALILADVRANDEVLTQALTFVATANAISYSGAKPIFIDSAENNMGMCPQSLKNFLTANTEIRGNECFNKQTGKRISACIPMHVFGHPAKLDELISVCQEFYIKVIEDAAESLGSFYKGKHTGTIAPIGILSFNGNKIITTGGGGMILIQDESLAKKAKHLTTTAKVPHQWEFYHDEIGYNYRLPNLNSALGCAQMKRIESFVLNKRNLASRYKDFFEGLGIKFVTEDEQMRSNYWLNAIMFNNIEERNQFLHETNANGIMTRPVWTLMNKLPAFRDCQTTDLTNALKLEESVVNIPSSITL